MSDGAETLMQILPIHSDSRILENDQLVQLIRRDLDLARSFGYLSGQLRDSSLLEGVRGVGNELADKDLTVRVERFGHDVHQIAGFGLKEWHIFAFF